MIIGWHGWRSYVFKCEALCSIAYTFYIFPCIIYVVQPYWVLKVEGRVLDDYTAKGNECLKYKMKFSSFFKSIFIELDKDLYGPNNHLVEWQKNSGGPDTDGFKVVNKYCTSH